MIRVGTEAAGFRDVFESEHGIDGANLQPCHLRGTSLPGFRPSLEECRGVAPWVRVFLDRFRR